ncbi:MAG: efflux RND transporter periplasmic adaptor subunit [Gammaproteobacteria bacterium]|nr:efflux RND transporter periplasmic adaptor subunit [Gammaproteobacteria bacterium]
MKNNIKILIAMLALSVSATVPILYASTDDDSKEVTERTKSDLPEANVRLAKVLEQPLAPEIKILGTVVSRNDANIAAEVSGRLLHVAEIGTRVDAGDIIAELDERPLKFQLADNNANILSLEASLKYNQKQVERLIKLAESNNTAHTQLDLAISQRDMASQDLARAKVTKERTLYQLERTKIRAPFPGQVIERYQQAGEFSSIGRQVVRLVDTTNIEISAQAPVKVATQLNDNMLVELDDGTRKFSAEVRAIIAVGDDRSRNFELRIKAPAGKWIVGSAIRVSLPTEQLRTVMTVPRDALILRQNSIYLFKITDDNTATRVDVKTGMGKDDLIEVIGDLTSGDRVVMRGRERLREGQPVKDSQSST